MKKKRKSRKLAVLLDVILAAALATAAYAGYRLYDGLHQYHEIEQTYEKIREESKPLSTEQADDSTEEETPSRNWETLLSINPDLAGWISLADSTIDYPVVYAPDNSWYLSHLYDGTVSIGGSIFVDYRNSRGFTDRNTVIYGHHMNNETMFYDVEKYKDQSFYDGHKVISLETPDGSYELYPVAGTYWGENDPYARIEFSSEEDYQQYIHTFIDDSTFVSEETVNEGERTVLLSTCSLYAADIRFALLCKLKEVS